MRPRIDSYPHSFAASLYHGRSFFFPTKNHLRHRCPPLSVHTDIITQWIHHPQERKTGLTILSPRLKHPFRPFHRKKKLSHYRRLLPPLVDDPVAMEASAAGSWPPSFLLSLPMRAMYVRLVVFHMEMYFSMQVERQVCSLEESDEPGVGMHLSKQCSLSFCVERTGQKYFNWRLCLSMGRSN